MPQRPRMRRVLLTDPPAHRHILPSPLAGRMACARQLPPSTQPFCRDAAAGAKHSPPARDKPPFTGQAPPARDKPRPHGASVFPRTADRAHLESSRRGQSRSHIPGCSRRPLSPRRRQGRAGARSGAEDSPRDWGRRGDTAQGREPRLPPETQTQRRRPGLQGEPASVGPDPSPRRAVPAPPTSRPSSPPMPAPAKEPDFAWNLGILSVTSL